MALLPVNNTKIARNEEKELREGHVPTKLTQFIFDCDAIAEPGFWEKVGMSKDNYLGIIMKRIEWVLYKTPLKDHEEQVHHSPIVEHLLSLICSSAELKIVCVVKLNEGKNRHIDQEVTYGLVNLFQEEYNRQGFAVCAWDCLRCGRITEGPGKCEYCNHTSVAPHRVKARKTLCFCTKEDQFCHKCTTGGYAGRLHYTYLTDDGPLEKLDMEEYRCYETLHYRRPFYRNKKFKDFRCEPCFQRTPWNEGETVYYDMRYQHIISGKALGLPWCSHCALPLMYVRLAEGCARCKIKAVTKKEILLRERVYRTITPYLQERIPNDLERGIIEEEEE